MMLFNVYLIGMLLMSIITFLIGNFVGESNIDNLLFSLVCGMLWPLTLITSIVAIITALRE